MLSRRGNTNFTNIFGGFLRVEVKGQNMGKRSNPRNFAKRCDANHGT